MNINNQPYTHSQSPRTIEQRSVAGSGELNKTGINNETARANEQSLAQHSQINDKQSNKESLSASEYQIVAAEHQKNKTIYDNPQGNQRLAISSYQSVLHAPKREEIQRLVGIDTFA